MELTRGESVAVHHVLSRVYLFLTCVLRGVSSLLANLMLPDGAEKQLEDWTIFFLNQTPFNTIAPVLALETPEPNGQGSGGKDSDRPELLYVLNLVRTKHDKAVRRCAQSSASVCRVQVSRAA